MDGGTYYSYVLQDPRWQKMRFNVLRRAHGRCEKCGQKAKLQIHHKYYTKGKNGRFRQPWDYPLSSLIAVCRPCHVKLHKRNPNGHVHGKGLACGGELLTSGGSLVYPAYDYFIAPAVEKVTRMIPRNDYRYDLPPKERGLMMRYGNLLVTSLEVCRMPIKAGIQWALNLVSLGKFNREMKARGYDKMFHLYLCIGLENGPWLFLERNQVINMGDAQKQGFDSLPVTMTGPNITLQQLWDKATAAVGPGIFVYDPIKNNCQRFVHDVLNANGYLDARLDNFIRQDSEGLLPGYAQSFARWTTDLAHKWDHIWHGTGLRGGVTGYESHSTQELIALCTTVYGLYEGIDIDHPPDAKTLIELYHNALGLGDECTRRVDEAKLPLAEMKELARWAQDLEDVTGLVDGLLDIEHNDPEDDAEFGDPPPPDGIIGSGHRRYRYGGKYAHSSANQTRAAQEARNSEKKAEALDIANALKGHLDDVKDLCDALMSGDQQRATEVVMGLVGKCAPYPGYAAIVPFLTGVADLVSGHTNPMDPNYHTKIRSYMDNAFGAIPVIGPIVENWLVPPAKDQFNPPSQSYTGQLAADPSKAKNYDGNLGLAQWGKAGDYWKINTPDEMRAYNAQNGTNFTVYGGGPKWDKFKKYGKYGLAALGVAAAIPGLYSGFKQGHSELSSDLANFSAKKDRPGQYHQTNLTDMSYKPRGEFVKYHY